MMIASCRFSEPPPEEPALMDAIVARLGERNAREVELSRERDVVNVYTMDPVFLVYAQRACVELGGEPCDFSKNVREVVWPSWSDKPWFEHSWWERVLVRIGRR
ncbi:MAG: hypothetical protein QM784_10150 [Polyangiaceae bacterium]